MRRFAVAALLLLVMVLPALGDVIAIPMSQVPSCQPLVQEMTSCVRERPVSFAQLNQQNLFVPMTLPVRLNTNATGGLTLQPLIITNGVPEDAVMMPLNVPVRFTETPTQRCLVATLDNDLAGLTVLMPASVNGQQMLEPVTLKKDVDRLMVLPTSMEEAAGATRVPIYMNGELVMFPLDCRTTADGITFCPSCQKQDVILLTR